MRLLHKTLNLFCKPRLQVSGDATTRDSGYQTITEALKTVDFSWDSESHLLCLNPSSSPALAVALT